MDWNNSLYNIWVALKRAVVSGTSWEGLFENSFGSPSDTAHTRQRNTYKCKDILTGHGIPVLVNSVDNSVHERLQGIEGFLR